MAVRSKAWVGKRSVVGMACSNLAENLEVRLLCSMCRVGGGLCDGLITLSGEYYRVFVFVCVCVCVYVCVYVSPVVCVYVCVSGCV